MPIRQSTFRLGILLAGALAASLYAVAPQAVIPGWDIIRGICSVIEGALGSPPQSMVFSLQPGAAQWIW